MSVNTLVKDGLLTNINVETTVLDLKLKEGDVHYNPGMARDPNGKLYMSIRSCITTKKTYQGVKHPMGYENFLHLGIYNEEKEQLEGAKLITPAEDYEGFQWGIEDVRLFWREDGLHGVGVVLPVENGRVKVKQAEILINYEAGTYTLLKDLGRPFGHAEKNWMPSEKPNDYFDFVYSPTQIVKNGEVFGEHNDLFIHNGTPLLEFEDGYISIAHSVVAIHGERTYAQIALKWSKEGKLLEHSQFFHFDTGWREKLKETIEFASGAVWSKDQEELLVGYGVKDELTGVAKIPVSRFRWEKYSDTMWYAWRWEDPQTR